MSLIEARKLEKNLFNRRDSLNVRIITSLTMLISLVICFITSAILYIVPHGRIAYWSDWHLWGLSKTQWSDLHLNLGLLLLLASLLHLYFNWVPIIAYLKGKARQIKVFSVNFNISIMLSVAIGLGTYFHVPPMSTILNISETIKNAAAVKYGEPPYGHAELSSLKMFAKKTNLDLQKGIDLLEKAGVLFENEKQTIIEIAKINKLTPKQVYEVIKSAMIKKETEGHSKFPDSPPPGFGRKNLVEVCVEFKLQLPNILDVMSDNGVKIKDPMQSLKEIAVKNDKESMDLFEIIRDSVNGSS